ncbi:MAG: NAD(P)H-hydrate dehydratase [Acidobacteriales bacterium]|nr:NAD(P)H-hydrate dehydratase [Terriglobales bacterium]
MKIVTAAEMREIDRITTGKYGVPSLTLMENAGSAVAEFVLEEYPEAKRVTVVCGKGNNGGDGFVAARKLHEAGKQVMVFLLADPAELKGDAAEMFRKLPLKAITIRSEDDLNRVLKRDEVLERPYFDGDVLIDAILGSGFRPPLEGLYKEAIWAIRYSPAEIVSVDVPSGADADAFNIDCHAAAIVNAGAVVTFTAAKPVHVFPEVTSVPTAVADIGSPREAVTSSLNLEVITANAPFILSVRKRDANKGDFGHALIFGGSVGKAGAPAMAGMAALRIGAGLCTVATPASALPTVAGFAPELMTEPLDDTESGTAAGSALTKLLPLIKGKTVVAVGPGLSRDSAATWAIREFVRKCDLPLVLDADGLNAFEGAAEQLEGSKRPLIITPHPGEMARLAKLSTAQVQEQRIEIAREFAAGHHCIVVLKGYRTLVAEPTGTVWVNTTGNPGMATGGTGDILTGMISGTIAQHPDKIVEAVTQAVFLHGLAGDLAANEIGEISLIATDLLKFLPKALMRWRELANSKFQWINAGAHLPRLAASRK